MAKLEFYYKMLINSEKQYKNFLSYLVTAKNELMKDLYTMSDIADFFIKLDKNLTSKEYKILAGVFYSQTVYQKVPKNDVVHHFDVVLDEDAHPLFKKKNLIISRRL